MAPPQQPQRLELEQALSQLQAVAAAHADGGSSAAEEATALVVSLAGQAGAGAAGSRLAWPPAAQQVPVMHAAHVAVEHWGAVGRRSGSGARGGVAQPQRRPGRSSSSRPASPLPALPRPPATEPGPQQTEALLSALLALTAAEPPVEVRPCSGPTARRRP
jgi:hypothetical protein